MKIPMTFRLLSDIAEYLRSTDNQAVEIEMALRRSRGYQAWKEAMEAKNVGAKKTARRGREDRPVRRNRKSAKGD